MSNHPLVSVIMPTYNQAAYVAEAIESAIHQDYPRVQLITRDDGSKDETPRILADYAQRYPDRMVNLPGGENLGITGNCNRLLSAVRGKYVALFAGDDIYLPGKFSAQVSWLEADERRVLCYHDVDVFDSDSDATVYLYSERHPLRSGSARDLLAYPNFCAGISIMLRASCIPAGGYDARIRYASDWLFFHECLLAKGPDNPGAGFIEGVYARYRRHASNITHGTDAYGADEVIRAMEILAQREPRLEPDVRRAASERMATHGLRQLLRGRVGAGVTLLGRSVRTSPRGIGRSIVNAARYARVHAAGKHRA